MGVAVIAICSGPAVLGDRSKISVYLGKPVPTLKIGIRRARALDAIEEIVDKYDVNTVVLPSRFGPAYRYVEARYGAGQPVGGSVFWRVRP